MPAPKPNRVLPGKSVRELTDNKQRIGHELRVHVYALIGDRFIIAPLDGTQGLYVERREVTVLPFNTEDETFGSCICDNLLWNISSVPSDLRTKTGWLAFKASGLKVTKHFQHTAILISVSTINTVLRIQARPLQTLDRIYVGVELSLAALHIDMAAEIRNSLKAITILQAANLA